VYGTPKSGENTGAYPYPPTGLDYKVAIVSAANAISIAGIETSSIFVDGKIWADEIYLADNPAERIPVRASIVGVGLQVSGAISDINDLEDRMDTAESDINSVEADVTALQTDMTTAQGDIEAVETLLPIVEFVAEFSRNLAHEARYFGSAMDIKYDGEMDFSYDNPPLTPSFRRPRPYLSVRVGTPIATLRAGAVRGLSSDGYRLFILDMYDDTTYRLSSVRLDVSSAPDWENTNSNTDTVPELNDERPFLECSGHDVYLMSVTNKVATRYNKALDQQEFDLTSRSSVLITGNNTVICNRYYLAWYPNASDNIVVLRLGNTSPLATRIHNPEGFTSSAITTTTVNVYGAGRVLSVCSFGKICGLLIETAAGTSIVQARVDDNGTITIGSPLLAYDGTPTAYSSSCTDGEFFFFATGLDTTLDDSIHLAITTISREDGTPDFEIVFGDELTHTNYPGLFNIQQILADGNTLYIVCRTAVYAFKYNGVPTRISFCWSYPITSGEEAYCATLTRAGLIIGLKGSAAASSTQSTVIWLRTDTYGKELIEFEELELPSEDWLYRKPFRQLRTFMS
jgi:outer membrane murein-binding lipoprotein Lpp